MMAPLKEEVEIAKKSTQSSQLMAFFVLYTQLTNLSAQMRSCMAFYRHHNEKRRQLRLEMRRNTARLTKLLVGHINSKHRLWIRPKTSGWWDSVVPMMPAGVWKDNFRMSKETFAALCGRLRDKFERQDTTMRKCIPLEKRVAMCLYVLSSTSKGDLSTAASLFGVGRSTLSMAIHQFCTNIVEDIMPELIVFPASTESLQELIDGFLHDWQFPQTFGALDGCHICVLPPKNCTADYYCHKQFYSTVLLAMCDHAHRFLYINVGAPGRNTDVDVFNQSILPGVITDNPIFSSTAKQVQGLCVEPVILADSAFPLSSSLIKPYHDGPNLTPVQKLFNDQHFKAYHVIEIALSRLKARFAILAKRLEYDINNVMRIIQTCCTLHNLCEIMGDEFDANWTQEGVEPDNSICLLGEDDPVAQNIRNKLSLYFQHENLK